MEEQSRHNQKKLPVSSDQLPVAGYLVCHFSAEHKAVTGNRQLMRVSLVTGQYQKATQKPESTAPFALGKDQARLRACD